MQQEITGIVSRVGGLGSQFPPGQPLHQHIEFHVLGLKFGGLDAVSVGGHGGRPGKPLHPLPNRSEQHDDVGMPLRDSCLHFAALPFPEKDRMMIEQSQEQQEYNIGAKAFLKIEADVGNAASIIEVAIFSQ